MESVNQFAKTENDALKVQSEKNYKSLLECPRSLRLFAAFDAKALNCTELLESYLAVGNRIINCRRQTNRNCHNRNI